MNDPITSAVNNPHSRFVFLSTLVILGSCTFVSGAMMLDVIQWEEGVSGKDIVQSLVHRGGNK
ncbi:MAG: hypothetical protein KDN22_19565, partial [Verrucomicrobiae bacterium]|nr:hypothetical protein [Verrucomicrobiae bacterium]